MGAGRKGPYLQRKATSSKVKAENLFSTPTRQGKEESAPLETRKRKLKASLDPKLSQELASRMALGSGKSGERNWLKLK
jgi:hypothetical protein